MDKDNKKYLSLLPSGFADLLPDDAEQEARSISSLMALFSSFGYERVKPPLVEFEDSLLASGPGAALAQETFRLMDTLSHRMMGVRSDITPQIARIASSRLANQPRPLRLSYANDVLRTKGNQQRTERQFTQVGCELIGAQQGGHAEIESAMLALIGLNGLGLKEISIDLVMPRLVEKILSGFGVLEGRHGEIYGALLRRDYDAVAGFGEDISGVFLALMECCGAAGKAIPALLDLDLPPEAKEGIKELSSVYNGLVNALDDLGIDNISMTVDVLEHKGFEYHRGVGFTFFARGARGELGRGGRYDVEFGEGGAKETAVGFTLFMDSICRVLPEFKKKDCVFVDTNENWGTIVSLQEEGWIVVRGTEASENSAKCTHIYKNGKVQKVTKDK